jgi:hypothetical protein
MLVGAADDALTFFVAKSRATLLQRRASRRRRARCSWRAPSRAEN